MFFFINRFDLFKQISSKHETLLHTNVCPFFNFPYVQFVHCQALYLWIDLISINSIYLWNNLGLFFHWELSSLCSMIQGSKDQRRQVFAIFWYTGNHKFWQIFSRGFVGEEGAAGMVVWVLLGHEGGLGTSEGRDRATEAYRTAETVSVSSDLDNMTSKLVF